MTVVTLAAGVAFGLAPALRATRVDLGDVLRDGRGTSSGAEKSRTRDLLIATQLALAVLLLAGAGMTLRSFAAMQSIDPGFEPRGVLSFVVSLAGSDDAAPGRRAAFYETLSHRLEALPGVVAVSGVNHLPLAGDIWGMTAVAEGREPPGGEPLSAAYRVVLPGYFETMAIPLVRGRGVDGSDRASSLPAVVVNERLAALLWPGEDPLGKRMRVGGDESWRTVVGVARDARQAKWTRRPRARSSCPSTRRPTTSREPAPTWPTSPTCSARASIPPPGPVRPRDGRADRRRGRGRLGRHHDRRGRRRHRPAAGFFSSSSGAFALAALVLRRRRHLRHDQPRHDAAACARSGFRVALAAAPARLLRLLLRARVLWVALAGAAVGLVATRALGQRLIPAALRRPPRRAIPLTFSPRCL
jgi:putative ABC transport system permease protein